jgi:hypothetical protein
MVGTKQLPRETPPTPQPLTPDPGNKPIAERAVFVDKPNPASATPAAAAPASATPSEPAKPWLPLVAAVMGLFGSLAANVYLGWIAWDFRRQLTARRADAG